jgi:hypothetical protein
MTIRHSGNLATERNIMRPRRFDTPARNLPSNPFAYYLDEIAFQLEAQGIALAEDVRAEIVGYFVAGLSPVGAVARMLGIPRDDSPESEDEPADLS